MEYAKLLKPEVINVLPGCCFNENRKQDYLKTFKENLCFAVESFAPLGIKTVFEAVNSHDMPGFIIIEKSAYSGWVGAEYNPVGTTSESFDWL